MVNTAQMKPGPAARYGGRRTPTLVALEGKGGDFARAVLYPVLAYAADLVAIADDVVAIDAAMKRLQLEMGPLRAGSTGWAGQSLPSRPPPRPNVPVVLKGRRSALLPHRSWRARISRPSTASTVRWSAPKACCC